MKMLNIILIALLGMSLAACQGGEKPNIELVQDMMESPALKAQESDPDAPQGRAMRLPPEGTVPVGFKPYKYAKDIEAAARNTNPLAGNNSDEVLIVGQKYFAIHCAVCHGDKGDGQSLVAAKMPLKPPSVLSDKIRGWTDGQIYHVIHQGQGMMGPYASHIVKESDRWSVVNYIRHLQKETR